MAGVQKLNKLENALKRRREIRIPEAHKLGVLRHGTLHPYANRLRLPTVLAQRVTPKRLRVAVGQGLEALLSRIRTAVVDEPEPNLRMLCGKPDETVRWEALGLIETRDNDNGFEHAVTQCIGVALAMPRIDVETPKYLFLKIKMAISRSWIESGRI